MILLLHGGAVGHELGAVLLPVGVLEQALLSAGAALAHTPKGKDNDGQQGGAHGGGDDGDLRRVRERVPLLLEGLRGGRVVVAVERDVFGGAVARGGQLFF